jgi:hypothetical protein
MYYHPSGKENAFDLEFELLNSLSIAFDPNLDNADIIEMGMVKNLNDLY